VAVGVLSRPDLGPWRDQWDELVLRAPLPSPFLRSWWLARNAHRSPQFALVTEDGRLLGGMALQHDRVLGVPRYEHLGQSWLVPDHLDVLAVADRRELVVDELARWCRGSGFRVFDLDGVVETSLLERVLPQPVRRRQGEPAPWMPLPEDPQRLLDQLPRGLRSTIRRAEKRLLQGGIEHRVSPPHDADAALAELRRLHELRWGRESGFLGRYASFAAATRDALRRGEAVVHELVSDGEVIASHVDFVVGRRTSFYQAGRKVDAAWRDAGTLLVYLSARHACRSGSTEYDFLRGGERYKRTWAPQQRQVVRLQASGGLPATAMLRSLQLRERLGEAKGQLRQRVATARRERDGARTPAR
jgi:CelD/BcsL family acetyltransferase involved in cellulose biosynthesis